MAPHPSPTGAALPALDELLSKAELTAVAKNGVADLDEMLRMLPNRYVVPGPVHDLRSLHEGDDVSVIVRVVSVRSHQMRSRKGHLLSCVVTDGADQLTLTFFLPQVHMVSWHTGRLVVGAKIVVLGTVSFHEEKSPDGRPRRVPQITHPRYEVIGTDDSAYLKAMWPLPVYPERTGADPEGRGTKRTKAKQTKLRSAYRSAIDFADTLVCALPETVRLAEGLPNLSRALRAIHLPHSLEDVEGGRRMLIFEEAMILQTIFARRRALDAVTPAPSLASGGALATALDARLPFELTAGQRSIGQGLAELLVRPHPANVLLQGDVGSGKTVVALRAMLQAVDAGHQAVLLAPTEVLAEQHHRTITQLLGDLGRAGQLDGAPEATAVRLLTGSRRTAERRQALLDMTSGAAGIIIGTHALLTDTVEFASLALVVIDEQHRFGVDHRRRLRSKGPEGRSPHVIVMTATPIPRTAALATVGDLDVLDLRESPTGRAGVSTYVVPESREPWVARMWTRAGEEIAAGRQVFVVCARIDEDTAVKAPPPEDEDGTPKPPPRGVVETVARLAERPELAGARIGMIHGRQSAEEKQETMAEVAAGRLDLLVATTVIEVGVDVPNASVMIILDAEHFGVSQLHQLRGRIGRGVHPGIAFLDTRSPEGTPSAERLESIAATTDGFALAELDFHHRGGGDLIGEEQSGLRRTLRYLDVVRDLEILERARDHAMALVQDDPELERHPALLAAVEQRLADADPNVERS